MAETNEIKTLGVDHIGLTVSHLEETVSFFTEELAWKVIGELPGYPAVFVSNGFMKLTLWQAEEPESAIAFNRKKIVGLHHLAIALPSFEELDRLYEKIKNVANIEIEFSPELSGKGPHKHMIIHDPSGIRLEFVRRPAT